MTTTLGYCTLPLQLHRTTLRFAPQATVGDVSNHSSCFSFFLSRLTRIKQRSVSGCRLISCRRSFGERNRLQLALVLEVNSLDVADQPGTEKRTVFELCQQSRSLLLKYLLLIYQSSSKFSKGKLHLCSLFSLVSSQMANATFSSE
jgi:hypothetical protein